MGLRQKSTSHGVGTLAIVKLMGTAELEPVVDSMAEAWRLYHIDNFSRTR